MNKSILNHQAILLRPTAGNWVIACLTHLPFIVLCGLLLWKSDKPTDVVVAVIALLIFSGMFITVLVKLIRTKIEVTDDTISGRVENEVFKLHWSRVLAVWQTQQRTQSFVHITENNDGISIPLKWFKAELLLELIQSHVAPEAMREGAHKLLPSYQINRTAIQQLIEQMDQTLRVKMWLSKIIGWFCVAACVFLILLGLKEGHIGLMISISFFVLMIGLYLILASGTIEMNKEHILLVLPFNSYQIDWDEVTGIEMDWSGESFVLQGQNKRLACPGPSMWYGKDKEKMRQFLIAQIEWREIEVKESLRATWRRSKNTKVKH